MTELEALWQAAKLQEPTHQRKKEREQG
jgi:hypothetical protein